jgi:predicted nucleic acid-binding protein
MKMVSGEIEVESPVVMYDYATTADNVVGDIPIGHALAALGDPSSPSELAQRLAVAVAMLWPEVADADLFLPEKERPLRGVRGAAHSTAFWSAARSGERLAISSPVLYEWLRGPRSVQELELQEELFPSEAATAFGPREAALSAKLYRSLPRPRGREIDIAIAACAIVREAELWSLNHADFRDIPGLRLSAIR